MSASNNDLHRDIGRMESRLDNLEKGVSEIKETVEQIRLSVEQLTNRDTQRGAFEKAGVWLAGIIGAGLAVVVGHFWK